jgi:hypothetical protein
MKKILSILFLIFSLFPNYIHSQTQFLYPHFQINSNDQAQANEIAPILQTSYQDFSKFFNDSLTHPISVFIAESEAEFNKLLGENFPDWGIGAAIPEHSLIVLKSPKVFKYDKPINQVARHELAHVFIHHKVKGNEIPRFMDEGLAMYLSFEWEFGQDLFVARAVFTNSIIPLYRIESVNSFKSGKAELSYTESFLAASYFLKEYGKSNLDTLLLSLSQNEGIDQALIKSIGINYDDFQKEFSSYIKDRYRVVFLLSDSFLYWLGLAFLIIIIYFLKRWRNKKVLEKWEREEKLGKYDDFEKNQT